MGKLKIFPDDIKICPKGWLWVKTIADFKDAVRKNRGDLELYCRIMNRKRLIRERLGLGITQEFMLYVLLRLKFS